MGQPLSVTAKNGVSALLHFSSQKQPRSVTEAGVQQVCICLDTPLTPTETQGAHFLFALEKKNWATAVTGTQPLAWGGLLTLKHPEERE